MYVDILIISKKNPLILYISPVPISIRRPRTLILKNVRFSKNQKSLSFLKWYIFFPEKSMLLVSFVKRRINDYLNILGFR